MSSALAENLDKALAGISIHTPVSSQVISEGDVMPTLRVTVTHVNCRVQNDSGPLGGDDEYLIRVSTGVGLTHRALGNVGLGNWKKGQNQMVNVVVYSGELQHWPYIDLTLIESDDNEPYLGSDDWIGGVRVIQKENSFSLQALQTTKYCGDQTNPGSHDFEMTGDGAVVSIWFKVELLS
jgi:hypothetical protein